jgi:Uma2 family endonuclease
MVYSCVQTASGNAREAAMRERAAVIFQDALEIPVSALSLEGFRCWAHSTDFPERGRIDFLAGSVEVDMSPDDLFTHGEPKGAIAVALGALVNDGDLGHLFIDRTRFSSASAGLSVEPDLAVVLWDSVRQGRARWVPAASQEPDRYVEIEGALDLAVEIVSDSSVQKDTRRLPVLYARAGVSELWLVDARGPEITFQIGCLEEGSYTRAPADSQGWACSRVLAARFRLTRHRTQIGTWRYRLESAPDPTRGG